MIFHPIRKLIAAGIDEIMVVTGTEHIGDVVRLLGSGHDFSCRLTYRVQDEAGGIAQALSLAEDFVHDRVVVILGDNIFEAGLSPHVNAFRFQESGARILLHAVPDPERYGVAMVKGACVVKIVEKPKRPPSRLAVTGVYFYDKDVFAIINTLKPSARGELEITDVNNAYIARGDMRYDELPGWWTDAGTFESLRRANLLLVD